MCVAQAMHILFSPPSLFRIRRRRNRYAHRRISVGELGSDNTSEGAARGIIIVPVAILLALRHYGETETQRRVASRDLNMDYTYDRVKHRFVKAHSFMFSSNVVNRDVFCFRKLCFTHFFLISQFTICTIWTYLGAATNRQYLRI